MNDRSNQNIWIVQKTTLENDKRPTSTREMCGRWGIELSETCLASACSLWPILMLLCFAGVDPCFHTRLRAAHPITI